MATNEKLSRRELLHKITQVAVCAVGAAAISSCGQGAKAESIANAPVAVENNDLQALDDSAGIEQWVAPTAVEEKTTDPEKTEFLTKLAGTITERMTYEGTRDARAHSAPLVATANEIIQAIREDKFNSAPESTDWNLPEEALYAKTPHYAGTGDSSPSGYFVAIADAAKNSADAVWSIVSAKHPNQYSYDVGGATQVELVVSLGEGENAPREMWEFIVERDLPTNEKGEVLSPTPTNKRGLSFFKRSILERKEN